jgi:putative tryptophan/tyrosine transport system substrate-binding protein
VSGARNGRGRLGAALALVPALLIAIPVAVSSPSCAKGRRPFRVGVLCSLEFFAPTFDGFKARMAELGYREGERITYDYRYSGIDAAAASACLEDFARSKVDLILAFPTEAALEAKKAGAAAGIDVIFANSNIEGVGLVDTIRSPGKGITGVRYPGPDIAVKRFEVLSQLAPKARRYLLPYKSGTPIVPPQLEALAPVAKAAGVALEPKPFDDAAAVAAYADSLPSSGAAPFDAILMISDPLMVIEDSFLPIAAYAARRRIPIGGAMMRAGGRASIFGVSTDGLAVGRQAADLARKVLEGTESGSIPVVSAEYFLEIDAAAAAAAGIALPEGLVKRADRIVR